MWWSFAGVGLASNLVLGAQCIPTHQWSHLGRHPGNPRNQWRPDRCKRRRCVPHRSHRRPAHCRRWRGYRRRGIASVARL